eukprot:363497-Chlamydomonas_euryale.AAC.2
MPTLTTRGGTGTGAFDAALSSSATPPTREAQLADSALKICALQISNAQIGSAVSSFIDYGWKGLSHQSPVRRSRARCRGHWLRLERIEPPISSAQIASTVSGIEPPISSAQIASTVSGSLVTVGTQGPLAARQCDTRAHTCPTAHARRQRGRLRARVMRVGRVPASAAARHRLRLDRVESRANVSATPAIWRAGGRSAHASALPRRLGRILARIDVATGTVRAVCAACGAAAAAAAACAAPAPEATGQRAHRLCALGAAVDSVTAAADSVTASAGTCLGCAATMRRRSIPGVAHACANAVGVRVCRRCGTAWATSMQAVWSYSSDGGGKFGRSCVQYGTLGIDRGCGGTLQPPKPFPASPPLPRTPCHPTPAPVVNLHTQIHGASMQHVKQR